MKSKRIKINFCKLKGYFIIIIIIIIIIFCTLDCPLILLNNLNSILFVLWLVWIAHSLNPLDGLLHEHDLRAFEKARLG